MRITINFSSREHLLVRTVYLVLVLGIALGAAVFVFNYASYGSSLKRSGQLAANLELQQKRLADVDAKLAELKKNVNAAEVTDAARQADFANTAIRRRSFSWTAFLNRLEEVVPPGVGLISISPNFQTLDVDISGEAKNVANVTEFIQKLSGSGYFEDIPPVFRTTEEVVDKDTGETIQSFNLKIRYRPEGPKTPEGQAAAERKQAP
jgi:Tfp pilus assembly protein PilN